MGPSPSWLFVLVVILLVADDIGLAIWLEHHEEFSGRWALTASVWGAIFCLVGQGLEYLTTKNNGWLNDFSWFLWFAGLLSILVGICGVFLAWRKSGQLSRPITDAEASYKVHKLRLAFMAAPLSVVFPKTTLESRFGFAMGILLLIVSCGMPLLFRLTPKLNSNVP